METLRPTILCVPEVVDVVGGRIPVFVDGGFRRGSDVYKALALGARAVGIGRPYIYGLATFGQEGVERSGYHEHGAGHDHAPVRRNIRGADSAVLGGAP